jgi:rhodanese-related sulfurtransferase
MKVCLPVLLLCVMAFSSCAPPSPTAPTEVKTVKKDKQIKFKSQPVNMSVRDKVSGKSSGIGIDELYNLQQAGDVLIYDVRVPYFYGIDHIEGAINWPYNQYDEQVQKRDIEIQKAQAAGKKVVLYCFGLTCNEARNVARKLTWRNYEVYVLTMGINSWRDAELPVEKDKR